jgi:hypothetical protein
MYRTSAFLSAAIMTIVFGTSAPVASLDSQEVAGPRTQQLAMQDQSRFQSEDQTEAKVFTGTIWMNGDRFVLRDERQKHWYQLDVDQKLVAKFEGKQVKVIGTLDPANSKIHVQRIEEG